MPLERRWTAGQVVVEALEAEKVEFVFGLAGTHVLPIFDALADKPHIRHITAKHESAAAHMASTYGYLAGRPGVVLVTAGPGATNSITGVAQAYAASHPMVHITGGVPLGSGNEPFHGVDRDDFLHQIFADIIKWSVRVERMRDLPGILSRAFSLAASGRPGPVHVNIPEDLLRSEAVITAPYMPSPIEKQIPSQELVERTARALVGARRPMICAGRGVLVHRAEKELVALAEALSADEWWGNSLAWELMAESDLSIVLGMRSDSMMTRKLAAHVPEEAIFVALDEPSTLRPVKWAGTLAACDIRLFLEALLEGVDSFRRPIDPVLQSRIADHINWSMTPSPSPAGATTVFGGDWRSR